MAKNKFLLLVLLIISALACKKQEKLFVNSGSLTVGEQSFTLRSLRQQIRPADDGGKPIVDLAFCSPMMKFADNLVSGTGALVVLSVRSESDSLVPQKYELLPSFGVIISSDKKDTTEFEISSGFVEIDTTANGQIFTFSANDGFISGTYEGTHTLSVDIDGEQVGTLQIGDSIVPLQAGKKLLWGPIFDENLHYCEYYFYSCNLRYTDAGTIRQGVSFVVGLHSTSAESPTLGTYHISSRNLDKTALFGHKTGQHNWGTYWVEYLSVSAKSKTNILEGTVELASDNSFVFNLIDQKNRTISGTYKGDFQIVDVR